MNCVNKCDFGTKCFAKVEHFVLRLIDTGTFGNRTLKSFSKMNFENDEEFEQFLSEVEEDLKAYNQERADAGLSTLGTPPAAGTGKPDKEIELLTDAEIDSIVNNF